MVKKHTLEEINSFRLEQLVRRFKHRPHARRDCTRFVRETINELVHIIQQFYKPIINRFNTPSKKSTHQEVYDPT